MSMARSRPSARRGLLASVTDPAGALTSWEYFANRRGFRVTDAEGLRHSFAYNLFRRQSAFVNERGDVTRYAYDEQGNLLEVQQADRTIERSTWDASGLRLTSTDAYGATTAFTYDARSGNALSQTDPMGRLTTLTYRGLVGDAFDRPDALDLGGLWVRRFGGFQVAAGRAVATDASVSVSTVAGFLAADVRLEADVNLVSVAVTRFAGFVARMSADASTYYLAELQRPAGATSSTAVLYRVVNSSAQVLAIKTGLANLTGRLRFDVVGTSLSLSLDNVPLLSATDASITAAGSAGLRYFGVGATGDNFRAEDLLVARDIDTITRLNAAQDGSDDVVTRFSYDATGFLTSRIDDFGAGKLNATTLFTAAPGGRGLTQSMTSAAGVVTGFTYNAAGQLLSRSTTMAAGGTVTESSGYDSRGNLVSRTDANGAVTTFTFDALGRKTSETSADPDGTGPLPAIGGTFAFDTTGNLLSTTLGDGRVSRTTYDAMNRPISIRSPRADASSSASITTFRYDVTGNQVSTTDPLGRTTWQQFDALGRLIARTDALGTAAGDPLHTTRTEYDSAGRVTATIDELGRRTDTVYDSLGRRIRTLAPDAGLGRPTTHYGYAAAGNLKFTTDPRGAAAGDAGFTTWFFYDALGRQTATVDALGPDWTVTGTPESLPGTVTTNVTRTAYDALGRIASTTDALGQTTDHAYDNLGRKVSETAPAPAAESARPVTRYGYDAVGNKTSVADPLGNVTTYAYDARDRRTTVTDARVFATVTTFDRVGNTTSVTDASGNVTRYAFDRLNRLITETDPLGAVTTSAYDLAGNKTKETDRLGRVSTFVYDAADRLVEERWQASASAAVFHTIKRFYDGSDQLLGVTETDTTNPAATTAWQFSYDALGRVVKSRMAPGVIVQAPVPNAFPNPSGGRAVGDNIPRSRYPATTPACFVWHVDAQ
jgi:YD repeat-containing protein